ncbi:MAG: hypothetical protein E7040_01460 [Lentisphaerae bacterium]|nr:hypothetical protein [Lentisphaerota bacterium]
MKKYFFIPSLLLCAVIITAGCGDSKKEEAKNSAAESVSSIAPAQFLKMIPDNAEGAGYINGQKLVSNETSAEFIKMLFINDQTLDINMFANDYYFAGSIEGGYLAVYVQSKDAKAEKLFQLIDRNITDGKGGEANIIKSDIGVFQLIDKDTMFVVFGKTDLKDFKDNSGNASSLFSELNGDSAVTLFLKPSDLKALPGFSGVIKEMKLPELYQLESMSLDIADVAGSMKIVATFKNAESARKVKTFAENIINAEIRKEDPEFADGLNLSVSGNKIILTSKHSIIDMLNNALSSARLKSQSVNSISYMKQIGLAIKSYSINDNKNPNTLNDLIKSGELTDTRVFIAPFDTISKRAKTGEQLTPRNTSYAYLGKDIDTYYATAPVMIVKPWLLPKGIAMQVLYGDGSVFSFFDIKGPCSMSCRDVVEMICKKNNISSDVRAILLRNAEAEDRSRY